MRTTHITLKLSDNLNAEVLQQLRDLTAKLPSVEKVVEVRKRGEVFSEIILKEEPKREQKTTGI